MANSMPDSNAADAFERAIQHLGKAQRALLNATSDISDAAFAAEQEFQESDSASAQHLNAIKTSLDLVDYVSYEKVTRDLVANSFPLESRSCP